MHKNWRLRIALGVLAALFVGCGGPQTPTPEATTDPETATGTEATTEASPDQVAAAPTSPEEAIDFIVIPGERVGPLMSDTSREALGELLGDATLTDGPVDVGEGFTEPGTVVNLGPEQQFTIIWEDESLSRPLIVQDFGSAWKTPEGLGVGSSLTDVKQALGTFQLFGFGWDYEGTLVLEESQLDEYHGNLFLRLRPTPEAAKQHEAAYQSMLGDRVYDSDLPDLEVLNPSVYDMTVYPNPLPE